MEKLGLLEIGRLVSLEKLGESAFVFQSCYQVEVLVGVFVPPVLFKDVRVFAFRLGVGIGLNLLSG